MLARTGRKSSAAGKAAFKQGWCVAQEVTGDVAGNLRLTQPIGTLLLAVRDAEDLSDDIYETWVHDSQVSLKACQQLSSSFHATCHTRHHAPICTRPSLVNGQRMQEA